MRPFETGDPNDSKFPCATSACPWTSTGRAWTSAIRCCPWSTRNSAQFDASGVFETVDSFHQTAYDLIRSPRTKRAFAIQDEPEKVRERYGKTSLGQGALLARRLVENGVRFVTVSNGYYKWDHHAKVFENLADRYLPELDRAFSALVEDLHQRGMLDTTLVIMTGEFGRTPEVNVNAGRDHWPNVFSLVMAGAGVPGGQVWGASDSDGAQVRDNPVESAGPGRHHLSKAGHRLSEGIRQQHRPALQAV